jgi:hypothetical protein
MDPLDSDYTELQSLLGSSQYLLGQRQCLLGSDAARYILELPAAIVLHSFEYDKLVALLVMQAIRHCAPQHQGHLDPECQPSARRSHGSQLHVIPGTAVYELQWPWLRYC